ncbi:MAG: sigma-70 family RNA polymerase sigma factor [Clostridia bacterium]|nr:sigma-70 family RNA polymerase sigma factor [Clostridia bacterium]
MRVYSNRILRANAFIVIRRENIERVHKALLTLSDKRRELVHKIYYEEMTMRQVASQTGVSHTVISQRMKTIRNRLKKELRDYTN